MAWHGLWTLTVHSLQVDGQIMFIVPSEPTSPSLPGFLAISS
jgi:hypothetical protein